MNHLLFAATRLAPGDDDTIANLLRGNESLPVILLVVVTLCVLMAARLRHP